MKDSHALKCEEHDYYYVKTSECVTCANEEVRTEQARQEEAAGIKAEKAKREAKEREAKREFVVLNPDEER